ncbi:MAG: Smr/MutS family protein [Calditerrivibrio sp.]|nr:Smr/MutS family protein [Calditerrivibrio sp.]MCA1932741.1 Smr/MutS family protein [Calditerrivibrio sp.]MCA1979913.1 Smr/MutS family protein [Calditerrivibrio sp.]
MDSLKQIDFDIFKSNLLKFSVSRFSNDIIDSLKPLKSEQSIVLEQKTVAEALEIFANYSGKLPDSRYYYDFYKKITDPYSTYLVEDLLTFARFHSELNNFKKDVLEEFDIVYLKPLFSSIYSFSELSEDIFGKISNDANVKDDASELLAEIRRESRELKGRIYDILNRIINGKDADKFVQERVIKVYNNRLVLLLKQNFKQYINGIVHNISGTGLTLYVEPSVVVDLNNRYQELLSRDELEVKRILGDILERIKSHLFEINETVKSISKIYYYRSLGLYYSNRKITFPIFSDRILVEGLHHPIIYDSKKDYSVPIDFILDKGINVVVISGPNAGGKTAALKSIGLNTVIAQCGLPVFAVYAEVVNFKKIYADIGDYQSLIMDLSTFTSHMVNIKKITENADSSSLVLLDELGTGTDPKEGESVALAIIEYLKSVGSRVIVTTHFAGIRNFAIRDKFSVLYGVDFDYDLFEPRYKLIKNLVGRSDPVIIAKKLNFKKEILDLAEKIINEDKSINNLTFDELNKIKMDLENEKLIFQERLSDFIAKEKRLEEREKELNDKLKKREYELLEESYKLLDKIKNINRKKDIEHISNIKKDVEEKLNQIKEMKKIKGLVVGDVVYLEKYDKKAVILDINKNRAYVDMEGMKVHINTNDIIGQKIDKKIEAKTGHVTVRTKLESTGGYEIVLVGKTVESAWDELDQFIDKAIISGWDRVYVVHGRGSGALRKGLHNILRKDKRVKNFRIADSSEGGDAVTILEI